MWNSRDMDFILENGDAIYKSLNIDGYVVTNYLINFLLKTAHNSRHFFKIIVSILFI